jgi:hypothetical protein
MIPLDFVVKNGTLLHNTSPPKVEPTGAIVETIEGTPVPSVVVGDEHKSRSRVVSKGVPSPFGSGLALS